MSFKFVNNEYYRHQNCLDLDIKILKREFEGNGYTKLKVAWINRQRTIVAQDVDYVAVEAADYDKWSWVAR